MISIILSLLITLFSSGYCQGAETQLLIWITACDEWQYGSKSNVMQIQLIGINGASPFFYVNQYEKLPVDGATAVFTSHQSQNIGGLYSIQLAVDDALGYCVQKVQIQYNGTVYVLDEENYFGSGIILSNKCTYSYQWINSGLPLIKCHQGALQLYADQPRGIYNLKLHSCIGDQTGMDVKAMQNNVYMMILGKKKNESAYTTTEISYLDNFVPGAFSMDQLGDLIASNVILDDEPTNALYSRIQIGELIGIKLEIVDYESFQFSQSSTIRIDIEENELDLDDEIDLESRYRSSFENGRFFIQFFEPIEITKSLPIYIYGGDKTNIPLNVYAIFKDKERDYSLPFIVRSVDENVDEDGITWFDANDRCMSEYGTTLTSIHNAAQDFLMRGFAQDDAFIGLFDLTVEKQQNWLWNDGSTVNYTNWAPNEPNNEDGEDCALIEEDEDFLWNDEQCNDKYVDKYICASPQWPVNSERIFEINVADKIEDITLITIGNNNVDDILCIDSIMINDKSAKHLSTNYIGGDSGSSSLQGIYKYQVCKTEVTETTIDLENSKSKSEMTEKSSIAGLVCKNNNRMISSTCSINQNFEFTDVSTFAISNEDSTTSDYSWGSSYAFEHSFGFHQTTRFGMSTTVSAGYDSSFVAHTFSSEFEFGFNTQFTNTFDTNVQTTDSSSTTNTNETAWETSTTKIIECSGEAEVPPSHSIDYALIFNTINTTVTTYVRLKLTLCSALINDNTNETNEDDYIYIDNVPSEVRRHETSNCMVQFNAAEYIRNDHTCAEEQRLARATRSTYVPRCNTTSEGAALYDGCQCDVGDSDILGQCWCVDSEGNMEDGKLAYVEDGDDWKRVCYEDLKCENSDVVYDEPRRRRLIDIELERNGNENSI